MRAPPGASAGVEAHALDMRKAKANRCVDARPLLRTFGARPKKATPRPKRPGAFRETMFNRVRTRPPDAIVTRAGGCPAKQ